MSTCPPAAARYRAAAKIASEAFHGSATPSPSASTPQRSHVDGMNCIQPTAPAELGPMFCPKLDSILLIEARTCHGIPYVDPARCQSTLSAETGNCWTVAGGEVKETGTEIEPGAFGVAALGSDRGASARDPEEIEKPNTGGPAARAEPATTARPIAARTRRRISLRLVRGGARAILLQELAARAARVVPHPSSACFPPPSCPRLAALERVRA